MCCDKSKCEGKIANNWTRNWICNHCSSWQIEFSLLSLGWIGEAVNIPTRSSYANEIEKSLLRVALSPVSLCRNQTLSDTDTDSLSTFYMNKLVSPSHVKIKTKWKCFLKVFLLKTKANSISSVETNWIFHFVLMLISTPSDKFIHLFWVIAPSRLII